MKKACDRAASPSPMRSLPSSSPSTSSTSSPRTRRPMTTTTDEMLYAQPASVHFGGFQLERSTQQRVRVHNNSAKAIRLRYTFPTGKKGFRATFASANRPSFVSAGLSEELLVSFTPPSGFQYYYDCIQVRCEEVAYGSSSDVARSGATIIPLHAYPMVNEVEFPTRMDFGVVTRGACARKYVDITCSVPVEFEYEIRVTKPHPAFTVFPLTGSIPPRGEARIELEFRPLVYATASAELELHISQLGFAPRVCTLIGSSSSSATDTALAFEVAESKVSSSTSKEQSRHRLESQSKTNKAATSRQVATFKPRYNEREESQFEEDETEEELEKIRGIEIPHHLNSVTGVSFVLNQEPGKLRPKDLKRAIAENRALRQQQREEQAKFSTGNAIGDEDAATLSFDTLLREEEGFLHKIRVSKQVQNMFFQQELRAVEEAEKTLEFQSHKLHLGQRLLSREQISHLLHLRELNVDTLAREQRQQLRTLFVNVRYDPSIVSDPQHQKNDESQPLFLGELKTAVLPSHFVPTYTPDFKPYKNDLWARRQRILRRLVRAVSTCILRLRAQKRLNRIRAWIGDAKTRAHVREKVALDWQSPTQGRGSEIPKTERLDTLQEAAESSSSQKQCYLSSFPLVEEKTAQERPESINLPADWELKFNSFAFMELKPRDEALLMGHEPLPLPALPTYVPQEQGRMLRQGAAGECGVVTSLLASAKSPVSTSTSKLLTPDICSPSLLEMMASDVFLRSQASVRPLVEIQGPRETESSYGLRPRRVYRTPPSSFFAWQSSQIGLQSIVGSHDEARLTLSDVFIGSRDRKQVEPVFPSQSEFASTDKELSLFGDVWNVATIPRLAERPRDVPSLSDSESDDEELVDVSWEQALRLFEDHTGEEEVVKEGGSTDIYEKGELLGIEKGVYHFDRYRHLIRQERAYNAHRHDLQEKLPELLKAVALQIEHPDYALVLNGHGSDRPLHQSNP